MIKETNNETLYKYLYCTLIKIKLHTLQARKTTLGMHFNTHHHAFSLND